MAPASTRRESETDHLLNTRLSDVARLLEAIQHGDPKAAEELLPIEETAPVLGLSPATAKRRRVFARARLYAEVLQA